MLTQSMQEVNLSTQKFRTDKIKMVQDFMMQIQKRNQELDEFILRQNLSEIVELNVRGQVIEVGRKTLTSVP